MCSCCCFWVCIYCLVYHYVSCSSVSDSLDKRTLASKIGVVIWGHNVLSLQACVVIVSFHGDCCISILGLHLPFYRNNFFLTIAFFNNSIWWYRVDNTALRFSMEYTTRSGVLTSSVYPNLTTCKAVESCYNAELSSSPWSSLVMHWSITCPTFVTNCPMTHCVHSFSILWWASSGVSVQVY